MDVTPEDMAQTSNFLLSHTKQMVAKATNGNQGQTMMDLRSSKKYQLPKMIGYFPINPFQRLNFHQSVRC